MRCFSGHSWVVKAIRVWKMGSFLVSNWNCLNRVSPIGKFNSTKWTWSIKPSSANSGSELLKQDLLTVSETSISLPGEYWSSKSFFWRRRKNFCILGWQIFDLLKIDFNVLWSMITINLRPYKYSWNCSTSKIIERVYFSICAKRFS